MGFDYCEERGEREREKRSDDGECGEIACRSRGEEYEIEFVAVEDDDFSGGGVFDGNRGAGGGGESQLWRNLEEIPFERVWNPRGWCVPRSRKSAN